jgi:hypothetical protein
MSETIVFCKSLGDDIHLTEERKAHIRAGHPEVSPAYDDCILNTMSSPDQVRPSKRVKDAFLLSRFFPEMLNGKHLVVVVVSTEGRYWVATAYATRKLTS